jgi:hypothetical protein
MIVIRQQTLRTSIAMAVMVVIFLGMGAYGLARFKDARGRKAAAALIVAAGVLALVSARSITRGTIVAVLRASGLELRSGHFARWGLIDWADVDEVYLFHTIGMRMIGLRLKYPKRYWGRLSGLARWSLRLDRHFAAGADAYLSAAAIRAAAEELAQVILAFRHSQAAREHFGQDDVVLEFPTDVSLADVLKVSK